MTSSFRKLLSCRLCGTSVLRDFIDFGAVPLGNNLQATQADAIAASSYPLTLARCASCGHFQLGHAVDPTLLYATNYTYLSGIAPSFEKHFEDYAGWAVTICNLPAKAVVVDIGSNDGTCLQAFMRRGYVVCGVDPAQLPVGIANQNGIETINAFFDASSVAEIKRRHGAADFVTSHNVLAHVDDLGAVFRNVYDLLKDGGYFAFEVGYFLEVLRIGNFDTIYHEHLDYHHAAPLARHLTALGFEVIDVSTNQIQGGSIRLLLRKTRNAVSPAAQAFLDTEAKSVLDDPAFLANWQQTIKSRMTDFQSLLRERIGGGAVVAGYGAPTKATLLMKLAGIGAGDIAYIVDDNPYKTGRYLPGTGVAVKETAQLARQPPDILVLFAWNFVHDVIARVKGKLVQPTEMIVPLPEVRIFHL